MKYKSSRSYLFILFAFLSTTLILYPTDIDAQVPWPSREDAGPPAEFNYIPKRPGHYTTEDWQTVIDTTWGPGLPDSIKLQMFDEAWNTLNAEYAAFQNLDVDWDSLRNLYRPEVEAGVSRGGFTAIMNHLGLALLEGHTAIENIPVNWDTPLEPGVPLFALGARTTNGTHFGASLTPLPDSSLLVFKALPDHPLGLVPGDIVLGYDGIPWKVLYKELLTAQLPFSESWWWVSTESAMTHHLLMNAGWNWHLFDTLDVVKYATGETVHLPTAPLAGQSGFIWGNEQLPVPGVPWLDIGSGENIQTLDELGDYVSWGIVEGTKIGYIYVVAWVPEWQPNIESEFYNAIDSLMNVHEATGLILDFRLNYGGYFSVPPRGLSLLFNSSVETVNFARRCGDPNDHFQMCDIGLNMDIPRDAMTFFDHPIAVLTGPGAQSVGDQVSLAVKFHPMARLFGKPTSGAFSSWDGPGALMGNSDWQLGVTLRNSYLVSDPGQYLTHTELEIDEEVWLAQEDVAKGEDTVVKRAIEWIQNLAYAHDVAVDQLYAAPSTDTETITAQVENPNDHTLSVIAKIISSDSTVVDSASLVDDGLHDDGEAGDGLWGALWPVLDSENIFFTSVTTTDSTDSTARTVPNVAWFTTIGPVVLHSCTTPWHPDPPRPGDDIYFVLSLYNESTANTVNDISVAIAPENDRMIMTLAGSEFEIEDIAPGDTSGIFYYSVRVSQDLPGNCDLRFYLNIASQGFAFWSDSFSIHVDPPLEIAEGKDALPRVYALHPAYPNPFNPISTIRYDLPQGSDVSLIVFDLLGREVVRLVDGYMEPGYRKTQWDGRSASGREVPSGIYIARLVTPEYTKSIKMLLLK